MYGEFEKTMLALTTEAEKADDVKFPCKAKVADTVKVWDDLKTKDTEVETLRGETQDIRFSVETLTHQLKFYSTMCEVKDKKRFRQKKSFLQKSEKLHDSYKALKSIIHPQLMAKAAVTKSALNRLKATKKDDDISQEDDSEDEENELRICGTKCRVIPSTIRAKYIHTLFDD